VLLFPLYAVIVWWAVYKLPWTWLRLAFIPASLIPVFVFSTVCIYMIPLPDHEPRPVWLMYIVYAYGALLASVSLLITFVRPRADHLCHACGYDLSGTDLGICPECGAVARCRNCRHPLVHEDFGPCPHCAEPFPRFAPVSKVRTDDDDPRPAKDRGALIKRYFEHHHPSAQRAS